MVDTLRVDGTVPGLGHTYFKLRFVDQLMPQSENQMFVMLQKFCCIYIIYIQKFRKKGGFSQKKNPEKRGVSEKNEVLHF